MRRAAAAAVIRIANDRMAGAIRMATLARGHDPRDFALFAFGGAGPMHAAALAAELGIPQVMIPARPGITSAVGCITADLRHDYVNTVNAPLAEADMAAVRAILQRQAAEGRATIEQEGVAVGEIAYLHAADMQFEGQTHLLTVPVAGPDGDARGAPERVRGRLLGALRGGARHDPRCARQPPHGSDWRAASGAARRTRRARRGPPPSTTP